MGVTRAFYRDKYLICLYDDTDMILGVHDNAKEIATTYGVTRDNLYTTLSKIFRGSPVRLKLNDKLYHVVFIELTVDEMTMFKDGSHEKK